MIAEALLMTTISLSRDQHEQGPCQITCRYRDLPALDNPGLAKLEIEKVRIEGLHETFGCPFPERGANPGGIPLPGTIDDNRPFPRMRSVELPDEIKGASAHISGVVDQNDIRHSFPAYEQRLLCVFSTLDGEIMACQIAVSGVADDIAFVHNQTCLHRFGPLKAT